MSNKKKVLAFGEVMLRVAMDNYQLLEQTKDARLNFTGTGLNVLSGVSHLGHESLLLSQLPANRLGEAAKAEIRKLGIQDTLLKMKGNHMGVYILEQGFGNRPSEVTYLDRHHSSFALSTWTDTELNQALENVELIHICGISLVLSKEIREAALRLAKQAKALGKWVCFDFNYRPSLNEGQSAEVIRERYEKMLEYADIVIGAERDLIELLNLDQEIEQADVARLGHYFLEKYDLTFFCGTQRRLVGEQRLLQGFIQRKNSLVYAKEYPLYVFDRVGTGDAYVAGIIVGILEKWPIQDVVEFATGNAVLAHTTLGDSPVMNRQQVERFLLDQRIDIVR